MNTQGTIPGGVPTLLELSKAGTTSITVPANKMYYLSWVTLRYVASADVASRTCYLQLTLVDTNIYNLVGLTATASQTKYLSYGLMSGETTISSDSIDHGTGKLLPLYPGQKLGTAITNGQAADAWTIEGIVYQVALGCP